MVFESIVADVLNRFVGEYVENLDKKQLKIGIWGGDVVLNNLILKQSALKELDLPVSTVYGHLGKLVLKIPWKNLYSAPVEAIVDKLYLLAVPNTDVRYSAEKEENNAFESKKAELARIEQAKKNEEDKDKPVADKSFAEKLTAQIVNNVQIKISDIHVRYEDTTTTGYPFAFGVTLSNLSVHTTDEHWMQTLVSQSVTKIYKVAQLEMLSVYMNCNTHLFQDQDPSMYKTLFQDTIACKGHKPEGYHYIFGPISSGAKLEMVPNPESEETPFSSPKIKLNLCMETLGIGITRVQFQNAMQLLEAFGRMMRAMPYRKFRPHGITYKNHYSTWWKFAYTCVLETQVRRRRKDWSWENMLRHRQNLKRYEEAYKTQLTSKKITPEITARCEELERILDLHNIIVIRQKIELEVKKEGKKQEEEQKGGWFSSWWGGGAKKTDDDNKTDIKKQFEAAMTQEEKAKLFKAIGYQENDSPTELPEHYVAQVLQFELQSLEVSIKSEVGSHEHMSSPSKALERVMLLELNNVKCGIQQRPSAAAMKVFLQMQELTISGLQQNESLPTIVRSQLEGSDTLLDVSFETNPEDKLCDQRVVVTSRPLQIIYDAETIIQLTKIFKTPQTATISQLTDAAAEKLVNIKERSATGLQYAIANHPRLELNVDISPSYLIVPNGGLFCGRESVLVVSLGKLLVQTEPRPINQKDVHTMHEEGANQEEILNEIIRQSYDKFVLEIRDVQAIVATFDEDWQGLLRCSTVTEMHLLEPTSFRISAHLCVIDDDPRLAKCKIFGELPTVNICVTEQRVLEALSIVTSLPLPESDEYQPAPIAKDSNVFSSSLSLLKYLDEKQQKLTKIQRPVDNLNVSDAVDGEVVQFIDLEVRFVLSECSLTIFRISGTGSSSSDVFATPTEEFAQSPLEQNLMQRKSVAFNVPYCNTNSQKIMAFKVKQLEMNMVQRTYDLKVALKLGAVTLDQFRTRNEQERVLNVIQTPKYDDNDDYLFTLNYTNCKKNSPEFTTKYESVEQEIEINFSTLVLLLHEEALNELIRLANDFQVRMESVMSGKKEQQHPERDRIATTHGEESTATVLLHAAREKLPTILEDDTVEATTSPSKANRTRPSIVDSIKVRVVAKLEDVTVELQNDKRSIAVLEVQNLTCSAIVKTSYTEIVILLQDIILTDTNPATIHTKILSIIGDNALRVQVILFNLEATSDYNSDDMRIEVTMGCARIVFLNWFVTSILAFLDNFQAAQQRIKDASAAAAEAAKNNVVEAYSKATRMKLDIKVKAPIIVIPVDSKSLKAVAMDFGHLSITNNFRDIATEHMHGPAVIDEMKIELKDMKLSKVDVCPSVDSNMSHSSRFGSDEMIYGIVPDQSAVLSPTSFTLIMKRNLSSSWYREQPDMDISGRLKAVELNFIATDYSVIMQILSKNMTEGQDEFKKPPVKTQKSPTSPQIINYTTSNADNYALDGKTNWSTVAKRATAKPFGVDVAALKSKQETAAKDTAKQKVDIFLKFSFQIDSINIKLFTAPGEGLAAFEIFYLSLQGKKLTNGSLNTAIMLCDIRLDDIRPNRENMLTRLMERRSNKQSKISIASRSDDDETVALMAPLHSMIDVTFNMEENEMFADVKVSSFNLILSVDFLLKIQQFLQPEELVEAKAIQAAEEQAKRERKSSTSAAPAEKSDPGQIKVNIKIEQPDIILVEKMDDINCYALILNNEISLNVRLVGERQIIMGELKDLCLYYAEFNPERRNDTKHFVIHPCSVSLNGSTPEDKGLHLSLNLTNIKISVSPAIIELVNNALMTLTANEQIKLNETQKVVDYSDLWHIKGYDPDDFWFIRPEMAEDALSLESLRTIEIKEEKCIVEVPSISLIIETGLGTNTIPMLFIQTDMRAEVSNWSSDMKISSSLRLSMSYYNQALALWEYVIEPNEVEQPNGAIDTVPWELTFELEVDHHEDRSRDPTTKIAVGSKDSLEMTVSKTCLDVIQNLGKAFSEAIKREGIVQTEILAPYTVHNDTGQDIKINLSGGDFTVHSSHLQADRDDGLIAFEHSGAGQIISSIVMPNGKLNLEAREKDAELSMVTVMQDNENSVKKKFLSVIIGDTEKELTLPVYKSDKRYFPLYRKTDQEPKAIISEVKIEHGSTVVVLRGIVQVFNHFTAPIFVHQFIAHEKQLVGEIRPGGFLNVPLYFLYSDSRDLHFSMKGYHSSAQGLNWKEQPNNLELIKSLQCDPVKTFEPFYINAVRERHDVFHEVTSKHTMLSACYEIHLRPPLMLRNALPIDLTISVAGCSVRRELQSEVITSSESISTTSTIAGEDYLDYGEKSLRPGELLHLPTVKTAAGSSTETTYIVARLIQYLEKDWSCTTEIPAQPPEFGVWTFNAYDSVEVMSLQLGVKYEHRGDGLTLIVYCPFWMLNKTGLMLSYRIRRPRICEKLSKFNCGTFTEEANDENTNILYHPPEYEGPILFSFREKVFFGKKKAAIRVDTGEWSEKFSLDVAGSSGVIACQANNMTYQIGVHNTLTHNSLTKQIVFMPYYVLINRAEFDVEVQEHLRPGDPWTVVKVDDCVPLWPHTEENRMLRVKASGKPEITAPFKYTEVQCTLLQLKNRYGGINVDVHVTEGAIYITFTGYHVGDAPAMLINHTSEEFAFREKGDVNGKILMPNQMVLHTWINPAGDRRIVWDSGSKLVLIENDLRKDDISEFKSPTDRDIFWVSFLNGTQRVLLVTDNANIAYGVHSASRLDQVTQEIKLEIHGVGLSLVNNLKPCDLMYIGIASSGVIWEECKRSGRFKQMKIQETLFMENMYQQYLRDVEIGTSSSRKYFLEGEKRVEVDFQNFIIRKSTDRAIKRTFYPGLWFEIKSSSHQLQFHAKINRIQIDNQLSDCIFPVVLAPIPPPKSVAATTEFKPFIEMSMVQRIIPHSNVKQFKYLRVLMQEFHVKVDLLFINEIFEMISNEITEAEAKKLFTEDLKVQTQPLHAHVAIQSQVEVKNFYDNLHLGPLKIHVSFSMAGSESKALPGILSTILQGVGVTLTDINDVVFRLAFFEREFQFLTQRQLVSECVTHYSGQAVKQLYVLVLGLDVIGNPYGLVVGFTKGVEDLFYEPFQGAIQGPGEFAEGLVLGVRSLFGHTVGGAAGAVSKITGAMGKGLAALTFDEDYQKKRRDALNKKPASLQEGIARSGKGLVMGVFDGVTGVFTKPISGAKEEGVEGFFKGLGKGAVGLVARPIAGVTDFASGSFDAVKRATELSDEAMRLRAPRFLHKDGIIRPYNRREAEGNKLLKDIDKGKYAATDTFVFYEAVDNKDVVVLTDCRIIYAIKSDLFGGWQCEWSHRWVEVLSITVLNDGVEIVLRSKDSKSALKKMFASNTNQKKILLISMAYKRNRLAEIMQRLRMKAE